jgi:acid phosphatase
MNRNKIGCALAALTALTTGCSSTASVSGNEARAAGPSDVALTRSLAAPVKVLVVVEENHSYAQMRSGMPYLARLSDKYGYATRWKAITHPSLPNYLAIAGGSTFGIVDDKAPAAHYGQIGAAASVFDQARAAGKSARTYAESMPSNCHVFDYPDKAVGTPRYAVRHNPWVYFRAGRSACSANDVSLNRFAGDARSNALPNVGFLIPNLCHDAHSCPLATGDRWLQGHLAPVLASKDFASGRLVVVVTADEDDKRSGNTVLTSVLTPALAHKVVRSPLNHYSLTRYLAQVLGVPPLRNARRAPDMKAAFGL